MPANQPSAVAHWEVHRESAIAQCLEGAEKLKRSDPQHYVTGDAICRFLLGCRAAMYNHARIPRYYVPPQPRSSPGDIEVAHMLYASFASRSAVESAMVITQGHGGAMKTSKDEKAWIDERWAHARLLTLCFSGVLAGMDERDVALASTLYVQKVGFPLEKKVGGEIRHRVGEVYGEITGLHKGVQNALLREGVSDATKRYKDLYTRYKVLEKRCRAIESGKERCDDRTRVQQFAKFSTYTKFLYIVSEGLLEQVSIIKSGPPDGSAEVQRRWVKLRADYLKHVIVYLQRAIGISSGIPTVQEMDGGRKAPNESRKGEDSGCCVVS